jgi:hypothetical protein
VVPAVVPVPVVVGFVEVTVVVGVEPPATVLKELPAGREVPTLVGDEMAVGLVAGVAVDVPPEVDETPPFFAVVAGVAVDVPPEVDETAPFFAVVVEALVGAVPVDAVREAARALAFVALCPLPEVLDVEEVAAVEALLVVLGWALATRRARDIFE